jgi:hypothetical protein
MQAKNRSNTDKECVATFVRNPEHGAINLGLWRGSKRKTLRIMKRKNFTPNPRVALRFAASLLLAATGCITSQAYERYSDCSSCHGVFTGPTSPQGTVFPSGDKHQMHRNNANMGTACNLCHTAGDNNNPFIGASTGTANNQGLGCSGCHEGAGLRKHHFVTGTIECYDCHDPAIPPAENVKPPYYGTIDTKANNPGNTVQVANTNENWSVGDFLGLDNDGNNLYDLADYVIGPYRLLSLSREGDNMRVAWQTAGGRTNTVQAAGAVAGAYTNVSSAIPILGVGLVTNNFVDIGGATNAARFYRMNAVVP